jgi:hypothetical protein
VNYTISFEKDEWSYHKGEELGADLIITTTPEAWGTLFAVPRDERSRLIKAMTIKGKPERVVDLNVARKILKTSPPPFPPKV